MNRPPKESSSAPEEQPDVYDEAVRWFMALRDSSPTSPARDRQAFNAWLKADPAHEEAFARCRADWEGLEPLGAVYASQADSSVSASAIRPAWQWVWIAGVAATVAAVVAIGSVTRDWFIPSFQVVAQTGMAERKTLNLVDGSHIELNGRSRLRVEYYAQRRVTHLEEGEAFFNVTADPSRPFTVEAGLGTVEVLGTSFQVTRNAEDLTVAVVHGHVRVAHDNGPTGTIALTSGDGVRLTRTGAGPVQSISAKTVAAWRNNVLVFDRSPLRDVVSALQRYYPGTIQLDTQAQEIPLTAVVQLTDIESTLTHPQTTGSSTSRSLDRLNSRCSLTDRLSR